MKGLPNTFLLNIGHKSWINVHHDLSIGEFIVEMNNSFLHFSLILLRSEIVGLIRKGTFTLALFGPL